MQQLNPDYNERFIVLKKASLRPEKIVFYNQFIRKDIIEKVKFSDVSEEVKKDLADMGISINRMPKENLHNYEISKKAASRIKEKISWLYNLSKNQTITTHNNKILYSFKMNFLTLTLPSIQQHTTDKINSECLNQFITECNKKFGMKNYVWRLEFQKNGNAHYHIATDTYIEYWQCKKIWNRILNKLGYIDRYAQKFSTYTFQDYYKEFHKSNTEDYKILRARFDMGTNTKWTEPNTVDCRNVTSAKNIGYYISKYITKKSDANINKTVSDREETTSNIRLWFCSRSLSKLSKIEIFMDNMPDKFFQVLDNLQNATTYIFDYCSIKFFNTTEQLSETKRNLFSLFYNYAKENNYYLQ